MPASNAGPVPSFNPAKMRERARAVMDLPPEELDAMEAEMHPDERRVFRAALADAYEQQAQSDITAAREADTQTWQSSLGVDHFGHEEAPWQVKELIGRIEDPQQLRANLDEATRTGRFLPPLGKPIGDSAGVPVGTRFSVREAQAPDTGIDVAYQPPGGDWNLYDPPGGTLAEQAGSLWAGARNTVANIEQGISVGIDLLASRGRGPLARAAVSAAGAAAGRVARKMDEPGRTSDTDLFSAAAEGAIGGAIGSGVSEVAGAARNAATGRGWRISESAEQARTREAQQRMAEAGMPMLTLGETGDAGYTAASHLAAKTGSTRERERRLERYRRPLEILREAAGTGSIADVPIETLQNVRDAARTEAKAAFVDSLRDLHASGVVRRGGDITPEEAGRGLYDAFEADVRAGREIKDRMFAEATATAQAAGFQPNLTGFLDDVRKWRELAPLAGFPEEELGYPNPTIRVTPSRTEVVGLSADTPARQGDVVTRQLPATQTPPTQEVVGLGTVNPTPGQPNFGDPAMRTVPGQRVPGGTEIIALGADTPARPGDVITRTIPGRVEVERGFPVPIGEVDTVVNWAQGYRKEFQQLFSLVDEINPNQPLQMLDTVRRIQSWLGGLSSPKPGMIVDPEAVRVASALSRSLERDLRASPGGEMYFGALDSAKSYYQDLLRFQRTMTLFKPQKEREVGWGEAAFNAFQRDDGLLTEEGVKASLRLLARHPEGVAGFRGAVVTDLLRHPDKITDTLITMDRIRGFPGGEELFPRSLRNQVEAYRSALNNTDHGILQREIDTFTDGARQADKIMADLYAGGDRASAASAQMEALLRAKVWTPDQLRGYTISNLVRESTDKAPSQGVEQLDPQAYRVAVDRLKATPVWRLLDARSQRMIEDVRFMTEFVTNANSIESGSMAAGSINVGQGANLILEPSTWWAKFRAAKAGYKAWYAAQPAIINLYGRGATAPGNPGDWRLTREMLRVATSALMQRGGKPTDLETAPSQPLSPPEEQPQE